MGVNPADPHADRTGPAVPVPGAGRLRRLLWPVATAGAVMGYALVVHAVDPNEPGNYPTCPWLILTGTYCPGCGTLRATHALTGGDLGTAMQRNPLAVVGAIVGIVLLVRWFGRAWRGEIRRWVAPPWLLYAALVGLWAFWILRNIPGWSWLSPA